MLKRDNVGVSGEGGSSFATTKKVRYAEQQLSATSSSQQLMEYKVQSGALIATPKANTNRTSSLAAPAMQLCGHQSAVYSISLDPTGQHLASGSLDRSILLWNVYGDCTNYNVLEGHKNAILQLEWAPAHHQIISCSADKTLAVWDANRGSRVRKCADHEGIVNSVAVAKSNPYIFASGSDDCSVKLWDSRVKGAIQSIEHEYQITSVCISPDGETIYSGGIDNIIRRWDVKADTGVSNLTLLGHADTITGLALSPDGTSLLSNAMDSTLRKWDVRPFTPAESRCVLHYDGVHHGAEKGLLRCAWSKDGELVTCGSADRMVHIWDSMSGKQLYFLPGHKGAVNQVQFHEKEPIIVSCSTDKTIFVGELMTE